MCDLGHIIIFADCFEVKCANHFLDDAAFLFLFQPLGSSRPLQLLESSSLKDAQPSVYLNSERIVILFALALNKQALV